MKRRKTSRHATAALLMLWLIGCASEPPSPPPAPAPVASPQPAATQADERAETPPVQQPVTAPPTRVAVLDPANDERERARHRQALLEKSGEGLERDEVGYYIDIMEARLTQQLRDASVSVERDGNSFILVIAGGDAFDSDRWQLKPDARDVLDTLTDVLAEYRNTQISVYGHTDDSGGEAYNQKLSERRARSVANHLVERGIAPERIAIIGYGESRPRAPNTGEENRRRNRRIEIRLEPLAR